MRINKCFSPVLLCGVVVIATVVRGLVDEAVVCSIAVVVAINEVDKVLVTDVVEWDIVLDVVFVTVEFLTVGVEVNVVIKHVTGSMAI